MAQHRRPHRAPGHSLDGELLRAMLDASPDGLVMVSSDGTIVHANSRVEALFGYPPAHLVGESLESLITGVSFSARSDQVRASSEQAVVVTSGGRRARARRSDGCELPVQVELRPVEVRDETMTVATVREAGREHPAEEDGSEWTLVAERERIGRDLHDWVIQRLFAAGISLAVVAKGAEGVVSDRIASAVGEIDEIIADLRAVVFGLARCTGAANLREEVIDLVRQTGHILGHPPTLSISGPADSPSSAGVRDDLLAVLREALGNVRQHAQATATDVRLDVSVEAISLRVEDDGVGLPAGPTFGQGLRNIVRRAERHGGGASVAARPAGGTVLEWTVPLGG